jgi:hypothetical protein
MEVETYRRTEQDQLVGPERTIREAWQRFDRDNPDVYSRLLELCRIWIAKRPDQPLGVKMLFERLRWDIAIRTTGEPLKLNNNYTALYARKIMDEHPEFGDLFRTRRLRSP